MPHGRGSPASGRAGRCGAGEEPSATPFACYAGVRPSAICIILLLAIGIGVNTAVFSVVRAVLLRPLPYAEPERLVYVWGGLDTRPGNRHGVMTGEYVAGVVDATRLLDSVAVVETWEGNLTAQVDLVGPDGAERLRGALVTPNFFETLGAAAAVGRTFSSTDGDRLVVISDALWRRRFGADPRIVGQPVRLATGRGSRSWSSFTVAGILPPDFRFTYPRETEIYLTRPWRDIRPIGALIYYSVARMKPGVTREQVQAELTAVARTIVRGYGVRPEYLDQALARAGMLVEPVTEHLQAEVRPGVLLLMAVAALVLLIACVNLGLLLLSRTADRRGELGLRAALGAGRGRIVSQLLTECFMLSIAGAVIGVAAAAITLPLLRSLMPPMVPRVDQIRIDPLVLAFAGGVMIVTAIVGALAPAAFVMRRDLLSSVRAGASGVTSDRGVLAVRRAILVLQVAVVVTLLVGSGLLLRSFWRLQHVDLGFTADNVVTMEMRLLNAKYREDGRVAAFAQDLLTHVRALPGVARAGLTTAVPMRGVDFVWVVGPKGQAAKAGNARSVDPEYFRIMNLRLRAGRTFTSGDTASSEPVVVVSESYGQRYFGSQSPVGRALTIGDRDARIVGVVDDVRYADPTRPAFPAFYRPLAQAPIELLCLVVQPHPGMVASVIGGVRAAVASIDAEQPVEGITTIDQILSASTADRRFYAVSTGAFAIVAVLLAIAGIFGVVSRSVSEQKRELAIRVALGADPRRLRRLVYGYGLIPAAAGTAAGLALAVGGSRLLHGFLFDVSATDSVTYAVSALLILTVAAVACHLPARRALRVQPMTILKAD
jgi:predicted permease